MKVEISLPVCRYVEGDFVRLKDRWDYIAQVVAVSAAHGTWTMRDGVPSVTIAQAFKLTVVLQGGYDAKGEPMRPGLILVVRAEDAVPSYWKGALVTADTIENVDERCRAWGARVPEGEGT